MSCCSSQEHQHRYHHQSNGAGDTSEGAATIHPAGMDRSSALQIWMDHQYAEELAAEEIVGQPGDRNRQGSPVTDRSRLRSVGVTNFRHQNLWMATAQIGAGSEPTAKAHEDENASVVNKSETNHVHQDDEDLSIEVSPGVFVSLISAQDTWKAIQAGKIMVSTCLVCQEDLTSADSVQFVTCSDCWSINSFHQVEPNSTKIEGEKTIGSHERKQVVGIGVKNHEIVQWIEDGCIQVMW